MQEFELLIVKFLDKTISKDERKVLEDWILERESNMIFFKNCIKNSNKKSSIDFDSEAAYRKFSAVVESKGPKKLIPASVFKYAAILITVLTIGFLANEMDIFHQQDTIPIIGSSSEDQKNENNIIITLSDGSEKMVSANEDFITNKEGDTIANKKANLLTFDSDNLTNSYNSFQEIFIPFGQTFKVKLSDGTLVWLNSGSKLRFPQKFNNDHKERTVYLDGEAYFEVAKNKDRPFIVNAQGVDIKVLGTKFNVSSYRADDFIATTLIEGSVMVYESRTPENILQLTPSFQAKYHKLENNFTKSKVNVSIYTAWMQDKLVIDNLTFSEILVKLERKYHVKFINKTTNLNYKIYKGEFENEDIEFILNTISMSTPFKYEINQNKITITE